MTQVGRRPIDPVDLLLLKQETEPRRRATITLVLLLASMPPFEQLLSLMERTAMAEPRLRQRLVHPYAMIGPPEWVDDPNFDIRRHVSQDTLDDPATQPELFERITKLTTTAFDPRRPPWRAALFEGGMDADWAAAFVVRMSHVLADGLAGMQMLGSVVERVGTEAAESSDSSENETRVTSPTAGSELSRRRLTAERALSTPVRWQRRAWQVSREAARAAAAALDDPGEQVERATRYVRSLGRVAGPVGVAGSPALQARSEQRAVALVEVPIRELRRAAKAAGASLNDAYLAAVIGGLRHYLDAVGSPAQETPFAIPISTRARSQDESAGNRFAGIRFAAPTGLADPAERIRRVAEIVQDARGEPALDAMTVFAPVLAQLPSRVVGLAGRAQDRLDMQASYVAGPPVAVQLAGAEVTSMVAFGPLPGPAAMSILVTYAGTARVGFTLDTAAVTDVGLFTESMRAGFDEVLALADG